jgi:sec-independent protein translocase protein TatB
MGGLGPGIGGFEILVIGLVALLVVGPKDLPVLMRRVGQAMAKMRGMANEFRASFDEMARQSELDELRKEVQALRSGQMLPLGDEAAKTFGDIKADLERPLDAPSEPARPVSTEEVPATMGVAEWPEPTVDLSAPLEPEPAVAPKPKRVRKPKAEVAEATPTPASAPARKPRARKAPAGGPAS